MKKQNHCMIMLAVYNYDKFYNYFRIMLFYHSLDITVLFQQSTYSVDENAGPAQPVLVLSNPSSTDFNVTVTNTDGSATGE